MSFSSSLIKIAPDELAAALQAVDGANVFDVRRAEAFAVNPIGIAGAQRWEPWTLPQRLSSLRAMNGRCHRLVMVCVYGHAVSQTACAIAACHGFDAAYLEGGLDAWCELGLPTASFSGEGQP
ncbi:MAG: rhodanese-like domain-containing protein [Hyphomicrobiales bacterium]